MDLHRADLPCYQLPLRTGAERAAGFLLRHRAGSKYGILFKGGVAMEALKNIAAVVMDKTGTVTKGNFVLQKVNAAEGMKSDELLRLCASAELVSTHRLP